MQTSTFASDPTTDEDLTARQSRWGSLISTLEDDWDDDGDDGNENRMVSPGLSLKSDGIVGMGGLGESSLNGGGGLTSPWGWGDSAGSSSLTVKAKAFPGLKNETNNKWSGGYKNLGVGAAAADQLSLYDWIISHRNSDGGGGFGKGASEPMDISERRKYLEKSVRVLHSLVGKIVGFNTSKDDEIVVHPNFITAANVIVRDSAATIILDLKVNDDGNISADFVEIGDSIFFKEGGEDETKKKYSAMDALGRMAYGMIMLGDGAPSVMLSPSKNKPATEASLSNALSIHDRETQDVIEEDEIIDMLRKNPRTITSEEKDNSGLISTMLDASIPFPLCRFVSDLLDDEQYGSMFGRSEHSFSSFKDVLSDLSQMMDNPDGFLHASLKDRWKLVFGEKLYGRERDTEAFMDAADRVASIRDDPIFNSLCELTGKRREVVMVGGHSGAGKSRLVRLGGSFLEKRGWRFLRCKFDRLVHPEPLSILAYAFDEYFGSIASCPEKNDDLADLEGDLFSSSNMECRHPRGSQEIRQRLKRIICLEGLGILAKHIPSLRLILNDVQLPPSTIETNETMMACLFGKLLQALSSKRTPILFFLDDLQWADPLSLALLTALVKGNRNLWNMPSANNQQNDGQIVDLEDDEIHAMFVGSYRDNEVDDDHPLAKVLRNFESDKSINVTNISLSRFTFETLNKMLSESLCVPVRRVRSLSELVIQKTDGQPLHVIEFIQALTMDNLLTHSFTRGWEWDADSIDICPITDSVAELFAYKLRRLSKDILLGLQILSCFGSQIDQHVLSFVADYDGENSVDITASITIALSEGLIEAAAQLVSFSHDMIQKATIDSIQDDIIPLMRKLASTLIKNASAVGELDFVLFIAVDLINRIGSDATPDLKERALFAELNLRAASKAITVPDFAGGAKYSENGIAFLSDSHWETQYGLSLRLYEAAVLSHFSSIIGGNRDNLMNRINGVFNHAKDFSDKFKTHCVWIKVLSMTDLSRAIEESLIALDRLGEPLDLTDIDLNRACEELVKSKQLFSGEMKKKFLSTNHIMTDSNKVRAMKIMASLMVYYHQIKGYLTSFIACQMMQMSMDYGLCAESVFGAAGFAAGLSMLDIEEGSAWGRTALSLMKMYDTDTLVPSIHGALYGSVFVWTEPIQSTLEPLAKGIRLSFATGNVEFVLVNTIYYIARSFNSGKNIRVLIGEVEALARQHGNHFGNDTSTDAPVYSPLLQYYLTPLYNVLRELDEVEDPIREEESAFPLDKVRFVNNDDILKVSLEEGQSARFHTTLSYQTVKAFVLRDMDSALKYTDMFYAHFLTKGLCMRYTSIYNILYEALICFYFTRKTGEEHYRVRGEDALMKMKEWSVHSDWNFKNKLLLIEAESYNTQGDFDKAAMHYEASIKAAKEHKFMHEEALASELAGTFFLERGQRQKSHSYLKHASECYEKWGASVANTRVEDIIQNEFASDVMQSTPALDLPTSIITVQETSSKKRPMFGQV